MKAESSRPARPYSVVVFDYAGWERFVRAWQTADSIEVAARAVGLTETQTRAKAAALRKLGVDLRRFRSGRIRLTPPELQRLKTLARTVIMEGTVVGPTGRVATPPRED